MSRVDHPLEILHAVKKKSFETTFLHLVGFINLLLNGYKKPEKLPINSYWFNLDILAPIES